MLQLCTNNPHVALIDAEESVEDVASDGDGADRGMDRQV